MMNIKTKSRSTEAETMDDFFIEGEMLHDALDKIAKINQWLGGNKVTLGGVKKLIKNAPQKKEICIVDLGCGNGDMLRYLSDFGLETGQNFRLIGMDANTHTVDYAKQSSTHYTDIEYISENIFDFAYENLTIDIILCTLTLHHFKDEQIIPLVKTLEKHAKMGIVVNDLHRSKFSYRLFELLCMVFRLNRLSKEDGLISILRGFKKDELTAFSKKLTLSHYTIEWKWAFRYQWIIYKL